MELYNDSMMSQSVSGDAVLLIKANAIVVEH